MKSRPVVLAATALTVLAALPAAAALSPAPEALPTSAAAGNSSGLELVAEGITGAGGTDIEFFSRTLSTYLPAADAAPVTVDEPVVRHFAFVGNQQEGARIVDITSPEEPFIASAIEDCTVGQGDPQVNKAGTLATIAFSSGSCATAQGDSVKRGSVLVDLRDVYAPTVFGGAPDAAGSHNNTLDPTGRYLYISTSSLTPNTATTNTRIPIYDLAGWEAAADSGTFFDAKKVQDFTIPGNGPHDVRFSEDGKRAYTAGVSTYTILNTENPEKPSIISTIVPPGGSIGHDVVITPDKRFVFLGDEAGGGSTYPCPGGAVYVYDLADETRPLLLGAVEAGGGPVVGRNLTETPGATTTGGCTSHVMQLNPDGMSFTIAWYVLGTRIFDFSSFYGPDGKAKSQAGVAAAFGRFGTGVVETAYFVPDDADTWSAKQYAAVPGYVFSDDQNSGLYVTKITD